MASSTLSTLLVPLQRSSSYSHPAHSSISYPTHPNSLISSPKHQRNFPRPVSAVEASEKVVELGDKISDLTLSDAQKLIDYLQETLGVSAASLAPVAAVAGAVADAPAAAD